MLTIDDMDTVRGYEAVFGKLPDGATKATLESYIPEMEAALGEDLGEDWMADDFDNSGVTVVADDGTVTAYNDWVLGEFTALLEGLPQDDGGSIAPIEQMDLKARMKL